MQYQYLFQEFYNFSKLACNHYQKIPCHNHYQIEVLMFGKSIFSDICEKYFQKPAQSID